MHHPSNSLRKDAGSGISIEHGEDALRVWGVVEDEGTVSGIEGCGEDGLQAQQVGVRGEREVLQRRVVDLLAQRKEGSIWECGDSICVDDKERVRGFDRCCSSVSLQTCQWQISSDLPTSTSSIKRTLLVVHDGTHCGCGFWKYV